MNSTSARTKARKQYRWADFFGRAALLSLVFVISARAQTSESQARDLARKSVQMRTSVEIWSVHRREDIEEKLRSLGAPTKDNPVFVFLLSDEGYEFLENGFRTHFPSEGPISWYVGVSVSSGQAFEIDSREGFNRFARVIHLGIGDEFLAQECLYLYLDLHPEKRTLDNVVRTPLQLKQMAETEFTRAYDDFGTAETAFNHWWKQNSEALSRMSLKETFTKTNEGFIAKFFIVSGMSKIEMERGPRLLEVSLPISRDGQIGELKFSPAAP